MGSVIVTPFQVQDLNRKLEQRGIGYRVHLHDMCGGQSFSVEELAEGRHDAAELRAVTERFFKKFGTAVRFAGDCRTFRLA